jgi:hypothetical protein
MRIRRARCAEALQEALGEERWALVCQTIEVPAHEELVFDPALLLDQLISLVDENPDVIDDIAGCIVPETAKPARLAVRSL